MSNKISLFFIAFLVLLFSSCDMNSDESVDSTSRVEWRGNKSVSGQSSVLSRTVDSSAYVEDFNSYYTSLGTKLNTFTPSKFKVSVSNLDLYSSDHWISIMGDPAFLDEQTEVTEEVLKYFYADFTDPDYFSNEFMVKDGIYDTLVFGFPGNSFYGYSNFEYQTQDEIIIEIPNYTDADLPDLFDTLDNNERVYDRKYLGDNKFQLSAYLLYPKDLEVQNSLGYQLGPGAFIFSTLYSEVRLVKPGINAPIEPNLYDYITYDIGMSGSSTMPGETFLLPFDSLDLSDGDDSSEGSDVTIVVSFDLNSIVEFYDNGTQDKSDDILVFTDRFWERLDITVEK